MFDLTFSGLIPKFCYVFLRSLKKWTTDHADRTEQHGHETIGYRKGLLKHKLLASSGIHASPRVLTLLSAAFFSSAFDWTRGFHWLVSFRCFSRASSVHLSSCDSFIFSGSYIYTTNYQRFIFPPQRGRFLISQLC